MGIIYLFFSVFCSTGRVLLEAGVVSAADMTTEATVTKLGYLLGSGLPNSEVGRLMGVNLRGEMTSLSSAHTKSLFEDDWARV